MYFSSVFAGIVWCAGCVHAAWVQPAGPSLDLENNDVDDLLNAVAQGRDALTNLVREGLTDQNFGEIVVTLVGNAVAAIFSGQIQRIRALNQGNGVQMSCPGTGWSSDFSGSSRCACSSCAIVDSIRLAMVPQMLRPVLLVRGGLCGQLLDRGRTR